jgi:hypothetical protein
VIPGSTPKKNGVEEDPQQRIALQKAEFKLRLQAGEQSMPYRTGTDRSLRDFKVLTPSQNLSVLSTKGVSIRECIGQSFIQLLRLKIAHKLLKDTFRLNGE